MKNIYLLCGGPSSEHDIALRSAKNILENLDKEKYKIRVVYIDKEGKFSPAFDYVPMENEFELVKKVQTTKAQSISNFCKELADASYFDTLIIPCIHGVYGEDGTIQGFLDCLGLPYMGNGLLSSAICMDKETSNEIFDKNGLRQARYLSCRQDDLDEGFLDKCELTIGFPMIVKPSANGSSVGVSKVKSKDELYGAIKNALKYDEKALVEEMIKGQEIEIGVIGDKDPIATKPGAYTTSHDLLDYDAKYFDKQTKSALPYIMPEKDEKRAREMAIKCYKACGCEGFARVDLFYTEDGGLFINEINTFPGFTRTSFFARLCEITYGIKFPDLLDRLISDSFKKFKEKIND